MGGGGGVGEFFAGITWFSGGTGGSVVANRVHRGSLKKIDWGGGGRESQKNIREP